jgi:hypothetical protein
MDILIRGVVRLSFSSLPLSSHIFATIFLIIPSLLLSLMFIHTFVLPFSTLLRLISPLLQFLPQCLVFIELFICSSVRVTFSLEVSFDLGRLGRVLSSS